MKKKIVKTILTPLLLSLAFGSVAVGATFALFTDKTEVSINVSSGKIDLDTEVNILQAASLEDINQETGEYATWHAVTNNSYTFSNSGTATVTDGNINLTNFTPGDAVKLGIRITNKSTIKTRWRIKLAGSGSLLETLEENFTGHSRPESKWQEANKATDETNGDVLTNIQDITIIFPVTDYDITPREEDDDNQYQNKTASLTISAEMVQYNAVVMDEIELASAEATATRDGATILYNPYNGLTRYAVKKSQISNAVAASANDYRYVRDGEGKLVTDQYGYVTLRDASTVNLKEVANANGETVYLPHGTFAGTGTAAASSEEFMFGSNAKAVLMGATKYNPNTGLFENDTLINTHNARYSSGSANNVLNFNGANLTFKNVDFTADMDADNTDDFAQNVFSKTYMFVQNSSLTLTDCHIDVVKFMKNRISRALFDLRKGSNVTLNNTDILTYGDGMDLTSLGVGLVFQTMISVNVNPDELTGTVNFIMNGGKITISEEAQNKQYVNGQNTLDLQTMAEGYDAITIAALGLSGTSHNKLVTFYLPYGSSNTLIDADNIQVNFAGVNFYKGNTVINPTTGNAVVCHNVGYQSTDYVNFNA